jgi:hypothetical protein
VFVVFFVVETFVFVVFFVVENLRVRGVLRG